jgi:hypothetical protein
MAEIVPAEFLNARRSQHTEPSSADVVKRFTSLARKHEVGASGMLGLPNAQNVDALLDSGTAPLRRHVCSVGSGAIWGHFRMPFYKRPDPPSLSVRESSCPLTAGVFVSLDSVSLDSRRRLRK